MTVSVDVHIDAWCIGRIIRLLPLVPLLHALPSLALYSLYVPQGTDLFMQQLKLFGPQADLLLVLVLLCIPHRE
jgi:hypothetical protein